MKSIRYKITQIDNVVVLQIPRCSDLNSITFPESRQHVANHNTMVFLAKNQDDTATLINQIHAAIHKEFAGEWEPKEGEMVNVRRDNYQTQWSAKQFLMTDENGKHWARHGNNHAEASAWDEMCRVHQPEIPTGPCEVCYGIEGCDEGVQVSEDNRDSRIRDLQGQLDKCTTLKNDRSREIYDLKQEIETLKKAAKEKPVIRLDMEKLEKGIQDRIKDYVANGIKPLNCMTVKYLLGDQGYQVEWIGGDS